MTVIKINKTKDYTVMSNYHFKEKEMSLKAKGLLSLMLSLPPNWDYSIAGLVAICKENETSIKTALDELKEFGYLQVIKKLPNETKTGRIEYEYIVYEQKQESKKQDLENLGVEIQGVENPIQYNNKQLNIKIENTNIKHIYGTYKHIRLTDSELNKLKEQYSNWQELIDYLDEAIEMKGYKYKSHYLAIKKWVVDAVNKQSNQHKEKSMWEKMNEVFDE
jgi:hypothetical protein